MRASPFLPTRPAGLTCTNRALKTGGAEVAREKWDEADAVDADADDAMDTSPPATPRAAVRSILPDWTRTALPVGAPPAKAPPAGASLPDAELAVPDAA